jgi:17beta-estradiol 17-dehydrogenase / very-long-chain 3-oxoacyl-CoA reductase
MEAIFNPIKNFLTNQVTTLKSSFYFNLLAVIGCYYVGSRLLKTLFWFRKYFLTFEQNLKQKYGDDWVVITGATDGIGKSFAKEFVKRGHKLLLIARSHTKAEEVIKELRKIKSDAVIEYIIYDLDRNFSDEDIKELEDKLSHYKQVSILVNNAGIGGMKSLINSSNKDIRSIINVNLTSVTFFTKIIISKMRENKRSLIVFSGSGLYKIRSAYSSVYTASKCYMDGFMDCLSQEHDNIDFTYLEIGPVETNMNRSKSRSMIGPDQYCSSAIKHLGKYEYTTGHRKHGFLIGLIKTFGFLKNLTRKMIKKGVQKHSVEVKKID